MTLKNTWYASYGPYPYEDTSQYPDTAPLEGGRTPQAYIEESAVQYYHVTRKSELDSTSTSLVTRLEGGTGDLEVRVSVLESKVASGGW